MRVIWAIDPTIQNKRFYKNLSTVLHQLRSVANTVIEPVHILKIAPDVSVEFSSRWAPEFSAVAQTRISGIIHDLKLRNIAPPHVIFCESLSTHSAVDVLSDYARRHRANLILAQSHSRRGMSRFFLGSFAETLLFRSEVPTLLVGHEARAIHSFRNILFPTDLSTHFSSELKHVLDIARTFNSKITLFHSIQHPIEPTGTGFYSSGPYGPFIEYIQKEIRFAHRKTEAAIDRARAQGVAMDVIIDPKGLNLWENILRIAKDKKAGLIAMNAQSGPISSTLLGSTTRQVVRRASCPVWVLKPRALYLTQAPSQAKAA